VLDNVEVIKHADIIYTLVPTPSLPDGSYDVSAVWQVVTDIQSCEFPFKQQEFCCWMHD
jgi:UDP-glucose 6-dehydrogenase